MKHTKDAAKAKAAALRKAEQRVLAEVLAAGDFIYSDHPIALAGLLVAVRHLRALGWTPKS